jgi:AcrR family transcriptional regulator
VAPRVDRRSASAPKVGPNDVLDAALTLFAQRGYHGTSLKDVSTALGIRTPSLYNHMESKSSLLQMIVTETLNQVVADFDEAVARVDGAENRLWAATKVYALFHATHPRQTIVVNQDTVHLDEPDLSAAQAIRRDHERQFRQLIIDGKESGQFSVESPKLASFGIREMCVSIARWFRAGGQFTAEDVARQYADYALQIVGAQHIKGRRGK